MIENLSNKLESTMIMEDTVSDQVATLLDIDVSQALQMIKTLSFSQYLELNHAIQSGDQELVTSLLSVDEDANSFRQARTPDLPYDPMADKMGGKDAKNSLNVRSATTGSDLTIDGHDTKVKSIDKVPGSHGTVLNTQDGSTIEIRDKNAPPKFDATNAAEAEAEIARIKQLAGIEDDVTEDGAITCAAKSGAVTGPAELRNRHKRKKKPGPKV